MREVKRGIRGITVNKFDLLRSCQQGIPIMQRMIASQGRFKPIGGWYMYEYSENKQREDGRKRREKVQEGKLSKYKNYFQVESPQEELMLTNTHVSQLWKK